MGKASKCMAQIDLQVVSIGEEYLSRWAFRLLISYGLYKRWAMKKKNPTNRSKLIVGMQITLES